MFDNLCNIVIAALIALASFYAGAWWQQNEQKREACQTLMQLQKAWIGEINENAPVMVQCKDYM